MASYASDKKQILLRLRKMEGQLKGIHKMVEEDKYCVDVLNQLYSIIAATQNVAGVILKDHVQGCVKNALKRDEDCDAYVDELVTVVQRYARR